jgi:hypothetical protein
MVFMHHRLIGFVNHRTDFILTFWLFSLAVLEFKVKYCGAGVRV